MIYTILANSRMCDKGCNEECVAAYPPWGMWGKGCRIDRSDPETVDVWSGAMKAKSACVHNAIEIKVDGVSRV